MINKYLKRGLLLFLAGVALILFGYYLKDTELMKYGWAMVIGYVAFGLGFLYIIYSLIRKIDRRAILEERADDAERTEDTDGAHKG